VPSSRSVFAVYLLGLGPWFVPLGIQMVLFPWLVAVVLHMDAFAVGVAQAALMAPALLFLPLGGLVADRGNPRPPAAALSQCSMPRRRLALAAVLYSGGLSYPLLIVYGIASGANRRLRHPRPATRLLPVVAKGVGLPRAVGARPRRLQFIGQLLGIACASTADRFGGRAAPRAARRTGASGMPRRLAAARFRRRIRRSCIRDSGAASAKASRWRAKSDQIWPVLLINFRASASSMSGPSWRCCRSPCATNYAGGALELSYVNLAFWAATIVASIALVGFGATAHPCVGG